MRIRPAAGPRPSGRRRRVVPSPIRGAQGGIDGMHPFVRQSVAGLLALLLLLVVGPGTAAAHSDLESSDPADGAVLAQAPESVSFTFNEDLLAQGNAVILTALKTKERLALGRVKVKGPTIEVAWPEESPAGDFRAAYRVVSADGHPIEGAITFTVERAVAAQQSAPAEDATPAPSPSGSSSPTPEPRSAVPVPVAADAGPDEGGGAGSTTWILGLGLVLVAGAGIGAWAIRRAR